MLSPNTNRPVPNQFILTDDEGNKYFQSYNTIIVKVTPNQVFLDNDAWDYSRTTSRWRNEFLGETNKEVERKIKDGTYILTDLND